MANDENFKWLERYIKRGWYLFPVCPDSKKPRIKNNLDDASSEPEKLREWLERWPNSNWGLSLAKSGLIAIDIDANGLALWEGYVTHNGEPETLKAASGSGIGRHYIFKARPGVKYRGHFENPSRGKLKGIDVKHNGYVLVTPSSHPSGGQYKWLNTAQPTDLPAWLGELCIKPERVERPAETLQKSVDGKYYGEIVRQLKEKQLTYQQWVSCGMALHAAFEGDDVGRELWLDLTQGASFRQGDLEAADAKWEGFDATSGRTAGTLIYVARELGCAIPNPSLANDRIKFARDARQRMEAETDVEWFTDEQHSQCTLNPDAIIDWMNHQGFVVFTGDNIGQVGRTWIAEGIRQVRLLDRNAFETLTATHWLKSYDAKLTEHYEPGADVWRQSTKRTTFSRIVFKPEAADDELNLWSPIPCPAKWGDIDDVITLVERVICDGDTRRAAYLLDWCAQLVQKPWIKSTIVPVLIGEQGTGKGLFTDGILGGVLKAFYCRLDKPGLIIEKFNVEQSRKFLTVLDESSWKGHHDITNVLKSLTGNATMTVEEKFGGRYTIENYSRYIVTSNDHEAVKIEPSNRRYLVLDVSPHKRDADFYARLWDGVRSGAVCQAFYAFLLARDISHFDPFVFPKELDTEGRDTKLRSLGIVGQFWAELLLDIPRAVFRVGVIGGKTTLVVSKARAYAEFNEYQKYTKVRVGNNAFWSDTYQVLPALKYAEARAIIGGVRERCVVKSPAEMRREFCERQRIRLPDDAPLDSEYLAASPTFDDTDF